MSGNTERLYALDAVRALALLLGIVLHATMSFFIFVPAQDSSPSTELGVLFYVIHIFRMSAFYLIAGFFAHLVFHRRGLAVFAADRAKRIGIPMLAGWFVIGWPTAVVVFWGIARTFGDTLPPELAALETTPGVPLFHFWFLYYLLILYGLTLAVRFAFVAFVDHDGRLRGKADGLLSAGLRSPAAPVVLAAPLACWMHFDTGWMVWFGIMTPDTGLAPQAGALVGFGTAFAFGWLLHRQTELLGEIRARWAAYLAAAVVLTVLGLWVVGLEPDLENPYSIPGPAWFRPAYALGYAVSIWCWSFALIGAAMRFCSGPSPLWRYLADSSYWLYIAHLPIVFLLQVLLMDVPWHWSIKFPLILAVSMAVLLPSYHYLVRPTFLGQLLNGRRLEGTPMFRRLQSRPDPGPESSRS